MDLSCFMGIFVLGRKRRQSPDFLYFVFLCLLLGLTLGIIFFLVLHLSPICSQQVTLAASCCLGIIASVLAYCSRSARCLSLLFLLSGVMKEGRNALIASGTGIIVFYNVKNIFQNLKNLADSITCNLEAKRLSLRIFPIDVYLEVIRFIRHQCKQFFTPLDNIVTFFNTFQCHALISDKDFKAVLNQTKEDIVNVSEYVSSWLDMASYTGHVILLVLGISFVLLGSGLFLRKFLAADSKRFDNVYITKRFIHYDNCKRQENMLCVLPLNKNEKKDWIQIPSLKISKNQMKKASFFFFPVFTNIIIWSLLTFLDLVIYWIIFTVSKHLQEIPPFVVPVKASFLGQQTIQGYDYERPVSGKYNKSIQIYLFEPMCTPTPAMSLSDSWIPLSIIILFLLILGSLSGVLIQIKMLVVASFYPDKDLERIHYLHNNMLKKRSQTQAYGGRQTFSTIVSQASFWFPILKMKYSALSNKEDLANET
ncbi:dendritic cell-specific transmembrane protein [Spea bombifrons]|uniref:dendritic cell-specific transmembrane protein n=1 Tax=Spea bombifrons TaxID=233779 RepID=UPI00234AD4E4|nr:dendritic cell-specific transmembrane protein [Spea bombifrons]